jgi:predicted alpha/beta superfamily hydrolase
MSTIYRLTVLLLTALATACGSAPPAAPRAPSARPGVQVLATPFTIPVLDRLRTVRLYLPPGYGSGSQRYPVVYMHDGQNLFDDATSYAGEWGVDETLDASAARGGLEAIVVGIDNGGVLRMTELNPFDHPRFGKGEGRPYVDFIAQVLKPWVDSHYRTLTGPEHTAVIGSSMGGLISDYAIHRHPTVFGRAGVLSPAYWTAPGIHEHAQDNPLPPGARVYFSMGEREGKSAIPDVQRMHALMAAQRPEPGAVTLRIVPGAQHNEAAWRAELPLVLDFLFAPVPAARAVANAR